MLKRVIFILKKENAIDEMGKLLEELAANKVETEWQQRLGRETDDLEKMLQKHQPEGTGHAGSVLYITDDAASQKLLKARNLPTVIYLHDENRAEDFSRAEYAIEQIEEVEYESLELAYLRLTGQPWTILATDRCIIRETTLEDVDSFYEIYKEPSITEYMENLYADRDAELAYIQDYIKNMYGFYGYGMWTVLEKASGKVIGRAGISWREGYDVPELGFVIAVPYQRQGYAYEVCKAILAYGKEELGFANFQAVMMEGNEKSRALCRKLGFSYEEELRMDGADYRRMLFVGENGAMGN